MSLTTCYECDLCDKDITIRLERVIVDSLLIRRRKYIPHKRKTKKDKLLTFCLCEKCYVETLAETRKMLSVREDIPLYINSENFLVRDRAVLELQFSDMAEVKEALK